MKKKIISLALVLCVLLASVIFVGCAENHNKEGYLLYDCAVPSADNIDMVELFAYNGGETVNLKSEDIAFLEYYKYKEDYPDDKLHELFIFPGVTKLDIECDGTVIAFYILENGDIVTNKKDNTFKTYTADEKYLATREKIDELSGYSAESDSAPQSTKLDDGTYLYFQSTIPSGKVIEFKNEKGAVLLTQDDIEFVYLKYSEINNYFVEIKFTDDGTTRFAKATEENIGKTITVSADNEVLLSPIVMGKITGGSAVLTVNEGYEAAKTLHNKFTK